MIENDVKGEGKREKSRCEHVSAKGRRCRLEAGPGGNLCVKHAREEEADADALAAELMEAGGDFSSPEDVKRVMAKVFRATVERRLSLKEAGMLCYIAQTILHAHRAIAYQQKLDAETEEKARRDEDKASFRWTLDNMTGPIRDDPPDPFFDDLPEPIRDDPPESTHPSINSAAQTTDSLAAASNSAASAADSGAVEAKNSSATAVTADSSTKQVGAATPPTSSTKPPNGGKLPPPVVTEPAPRPPDLNHFYPRDPTLAPGLQDPARLTASPPDDEEFARRNRRFNRMHGYRR